MASLLPQYSILGQPALREPDPVVGPNDLRFSCGRLARSSNSMFRCPPPADSDGSSLARCRPAASNHRDVRSELTTPARQRWLRLAVGAIETPRPVLPAGSEQETDQENWHRPPRFGNSESLRIRLTNPASAAGDSPALVEFYGLLSATGGRRQNGARARSARQLQAVVRPLPGTVAATESRPTRSPARRLSARSTQLPAAADRGSCRTRTLRA